MALASPLPPADPRLSLLGSAQSQTDRALAALEKEMRENRDETNRRFDVLETSQTALGARMTLEIGLVNRKLDTIERDSAYVKEHVGLLTGMVTTLDKRVEGLETKVTEIGIKVDTLEIRFDGLETRFDGLEARFDGLETRFDGLETRFDGIETRFDGLEARFDGLETRFDGIEQKTDALTDAVAELLRRVPQNADN